MSSTAATSRARQGFPVGRRRYVPVVDGGCGCRPRGRPWLLTSLLPSFLKPSSFGCTQLGGGGVKHATAVRRRSGGEKYSSTTSSTSTAASFSSSSRAAATHSTAGYSSSAYSDYCYGVAVPSVAATKKPPQQQQQQPAVVVPHKHHKAKKKEEEEPATTPASSSSKKAAGKKKKKSGGRKMMAEAEEDGAGVGVAVEKESCDPRADFRDSMVAMVVEMGLCDWDGLRCMLRRLLALNAPRHHAAILTAFAEVCAQIVAAPAAAAVDSSAALHPSPPPPQAYQYRRR